MKVPKRYIPPTLTRKNKKKQAQLLKKSRKLYKRGIYYTRPAIASFRTRKSDHVTRAKQLYSVDSLVPSAPLAQATGCSIDALRRIVRKGEGAYYSSGSRPSQTAQSWGIARLASAITGGKSAAVDYAILNEGCRHNGRAFKLARRSRKVHGHGQGSTPKYTIH